MLRICRKSTKTELSNCVPANSHKNVIIEHKIPYNNVKRVCSPSEEYASRYAIGNGPGRSLGVSKKSVFEEAPSDEGKRSDVTGVNDSPVDCQSRDRNRRNELSAKLTGGEMQRKVS